MKLSTCIKMENTSSITVLINLKLDPLFNKVSFDDKNIFYIHPKYLELSKDNPNQDNIRLKFVLWSAGMLILKFIFGLPLSELMAFHKSQHISYIRKIHIPHIISQLLEKMLYYEESSFSNFYLMLSHLRRNQFYLFEDKGYILRLDYKAITGKDFHFEENLENQIFEEEQTTCDTSELTKDNKHQKFRQCPYCFNYIEYGGSRFVTCYSFICKSNKYFCWNCNSKLYINDKEKHFGLYGTRSDFCTNKTPGA
jgi:hypothetical protein